MNRFFQNLFGSNLLGYLDHNSQRNTLSGELNLLAGPWTQVRDAKPSTETGIWGSVSRARDDASRQVKTSASRIPFSVYGVIEARRCLATKVTGQNRGTLQITQNQAGCVSNGKERCERDGLYSERLTLNLQRDGAGRLPGSKSIQHVDTSRPQGFQSGSLPERELSPKTGYERTKEYRRVTQPILFS